METSLSIARPLDWQRAVLDDDRKWPEPVTCICVGRRAGKSHLGLLYLAFAPGGLMDGKPVVMGAPTDSMMGEVRQTFRNWFHPLIKSASPSKQGFCLENGSQIDFYSLSPASAPTAFRGVGASLAWIDEAAFVRN